jgi:nicotinamide-nucleotide amidase
MGNERIQASLITIGDELMIGQVIDTNSAWIAQELNKEGIWVRKRVAVGDNYEEMQRAFEQESAHSQIILVTGGLGPTADDITKPFLCNYFNTSLIIDEGVLEHVTNLFERVLKRPMIERNRKQAEVPAGCTVIHNARGTAPGMLFEKNGVVYISMPGVPHEMKGMMKDSVMGILKNKFNTGFILHRTLLTSGIGESFLAEHIQQWEEQLSAYFKLAYLPNFGMVRLRITGTGSDKLSLEKELDEKFLLLKEKVKEWLVTDEDMTMPEVVRKLLREKNKTVGTAESCTGGHIAHLLTREAGASVVYNGSIVSYSNQVKQDVLKVDAEVLNTWGAVSEETVTAMVHGALELLKTDYVVAVSGIMGPDGGTETKPVGTVWVAVGNREKIITQLFNLRYDRTRNIEMTANNALNLLRKFITS